MPNCCSRSLLARAGIPAQRLPDRMVADVDVHGNKTYAAVGRTQVEFAQHQQVFGAHEEAVVQNAIQQIAQLCFFGGGMYSHLISISGALLTRRREWSGSSAPVSHCRLQSDWSQVSMWKQECDMLTVAAAMRDVLIAH